MFQSQRPATMTAPFHQQQQAATTSMYSQLHYHHHHTPSSLQTSTATQQGGLTWNGSAWVSAGAATAGAAKPQYSNFTYGHNQTQPLQHQPQQPQHPQHPQAPPPSSPSQYNQDAYRYYYNQGVQYRAEAAKPGISEADKSEALRKAAWADYYASQVYHGQSIPQQPVSNASSTGSSPPKSELGTSAKGGAHPQEKSVSPNVATNNEIKTNATNSHLAGQQQNSLSHSVAPQNLSFSSSSSCPPVSSHASQQQSPQEEPSLSPSPAKKKKKSRFGPPLSPSEKAKKSRFSTDYYQPTNSLASDQNTSSLSFGAEENDFISLHTNKQQQQNQKANVALKAASAGFEQSASALAARANRFSGKGGLTMKKKNQAGKKGSATSHNFGQYMGMEVIGGGSSESTDFESMTVKGRCTVLEKEYLRLTAPPKAELVRPQSVLEKHFENLKRMYSRCEKDYTWFCSQFKAVRQDLTVQRINNAFTIDIYETHARIALEEEDLNEYNQCQTQLKELYVTVAQSCDAATKKKGLANMREFIAYRIIYYVFLTLNKKYEGGSSDLLNIMLSLTPEDKEDECIAHALKVRIAVADYDYHGFFRLHEYAPKMSPYLMDYMVPSIRLSALQRICKAYRPSVEVSFALSEIGFEACEADDGKAFMKSCGAKLNDDGSLFITKDSAIQASVPEKKNSLI